MFNRGNIYNYHFWELYIFHVHLPIIRIFNTSKQNLSSVGFQSNLRESTVCLFFQNNVPNKVDIKVSRKNVFEDSYRCVMSIKRSDLLKTR